jgi:erythronate-4-phosphate dehydrogenase
MRILADSNIMFVEEAFSDFGDMTIAEGREISSAQVKNADILLVRSVTKVNESLLAGSSVKFVASATTGTDHVDLRYLRDHSIGFVHAPGSNANSVAEYIVAALVRLSSVTGKRLENLTLGIIGVGNIGSRVLSLGRALGMHCLLCDPPKKASTGNDIYLQLPTVLKESDIVTLHVPLITSGPSVTHRMVNADFLGSMKRGASLINASRGDVLDEQSLRDHRGHLGFLVLDVWNNEPRPDPRTVALCDLATPHIAGYSWDGKVRGTEMIYAGACSYFFKQKKWRFPSTGIQSKPLVSTIEAQSIAEAVNHAYPILEDDALFRKIVSIDPAKRGEFFDEMRADYPKRFEFCNYSVVPGGALPATVLSTLELLGFRSNPPQA